jgi:ribosomal protein S12 methylthiotransferase accessory factor
MEIRILENDAVEAHYDGLTVRTAQDGSAPAPFDVFLASLGTCAGFYISRFCRLRGIPTEGIRITQLSDQDPDTHMVRTVEIDVALPGNFPERYREAILRAAGQCTVKRHLAVPPVIIVREVEPVEA